MDFTNRYWNKYQFPRTSTKLWKYLKYYSVHVHYNCDNRLSDRLYRCLFVLDIREATGLALHLSIFDYALLAGQTDEIYKNIDSGGDYVKTMNKEWSSGWIIIRCVSREGKNTFFLDYVTAFTRGSRILQDYINAFDYIRWVTEHSSNAMILPSRRYARQRRLCR